MSSEIGKLKRPVALTIFNNGVNMKRRLVLVTLLLATVTTNSMAKKIYGDVQVTDIGLSDNFIWKRANKNAPIYPIELASSGMRGCAVLSFNISEAGKTDSVEIINSVPKKQIGKYSRKMLRKWKWVPASSAMEPAAEKRILRLDFCLGGDSTEQSQIACKQQTQLACAMK